MGAHDANLIKLVTKYLNDYDTNGVDLEFAKPADACTIACTRARQGLDTITCTGNVLRDYLTDLFPILELGTSAKMLSIVPLLAGGVLLETGAGGSAPKHVEQFLKEGHLRWDSLGEYLATAIGFQELGDRTNNAAWAPLAKALADNEEQIVKDLIDCQGPSCDVGGYYKVDPVKADVAMRPSKIFNDLMDKY